MAQIAVTTPEGATLYSVTVSRVAAPAAFRKALRLAWRAKGGAFASFNPC